MKKNRTDHKSIYSALYRCVLAIALLGVLADESTVSFLRSVAGEGTVTGMLESLPALIFLFLYFILAEAMLTAGEYLKLYRLFFGAFLVVSAVSFGLLIRFELSWFIPAALLLFFTVRLISGYQKSRLVFIVILLLAETLMIPRSGLNRLAVVSLIFLLLTGITELISKDHFIWIPYFLILSVLLALMPVKKAPFDWSFVVRIAETVEKGFDRAVSDLSYYLGDLRNSKTNPAGYNGLGKMGGGIKESSREELIFTGTFKGVVYLKGISFKTLEKDGWSERTTSDLPYNGWFIEYLNLLYKNGITKQEASEFSMQERAGIEYVYIKTSDMIHPGTTLFLRKDILKEMTDDKGSYMFREKRGKGTDYYLTWLSIDYSDPVFTSLLDGAGNESFASYGELDRYCREIYGIGLDQYLTEEDYVNYISGRDKEMNDPAYLDTSMATDRMRDLALRITQNAENDYEKAVMTEKYMRQYTYNLNADHTKDKNFTDSFLFDKQEGYCVHFASAMVELLRINGVKARYCEGFTSVVKRNERTTTIRSGSAHAWVEAWIDGFGWMVFEPTVTRPVPRENAWEKKSIPGHSVSVPVLQKEALSAEEIPKPEEQSFTERYGNLIRYGVIILAMLVLYFVIYFVAGMVISRTRYLKKNNAQKLMSNVDSIRRIIEKTVKRDWENAPLRDYAAFLNEDEKSRAKEVFDEYYRLRFSKEAKELQNVSDELMQSSEELKRSVEKDYLEHGQGRFKKIRLHFM